MKKNLFITLIICIGCVACTKKTSESNSNVLGLDYYPITAGKFIVYEVDSTVYTYLTRDTIHYKFLLKEKIADSFIDNTGQTAIRLERFVKKYDLKKPYDSLQWAIRDVYMINANNKSIQAVENNLRFTKIIFPVQSNVTWNGNANNNLEQQLYKYSYIDNPEKINKTNFDNVLLIIQKEFHPKVLDYYYVEKYAKGFGLVYKEITDVVSNKNVTTAPVLDRIESGLIYKQYFLSFGYE